MNIFQKAYHKDLERVYSRFSGIILDNVIGDIQDLQDYFENLRNQLNLEDRILISYHNPLWEPILSIASKLGLRRRVGIQNWLNENDIKNILNLSGFEVITSRKRLFGITTITIARTKADLTKRGKECTVSIIIPARNEEKNISKILPSVPGFGKSREIIFIEGNSGDRTWEEIRKVKAKNRNVRAFKQTGEGKADAVRLGLEKASGDLLMIYDSDRTVNPKDLPKFYNVLVSGLGEFANGCRLIYPMEKDAMQTLNKIGNQIFSYIFTKILGQNFKDTLCGTKALYRSDFIKMKKDYLHYLKTDPFGDFALIFAAVKHNLKVMEIPIRYRERVYGKTNINRIYHGFLLIKTVLSAIKTFSG